MDTDELKMERVACCELRVASENKAFEFTRNPQPATSPFFFAISAISSEAGGESVAQISGMRRQRRANLKTQDQLRGNPL